MLKRIQIKDLKVGMYIKEFAGSWLDHPFWRSSFMVRGERDLIRIRESGIQEVWIDVVRGKDTDVGMTEKESEAAIEEELIRDAVEPVATGLVEMEQEVVRASKIAASSSRAVADMFQEVRMGKAISVDTVLPVVDKIAGSVLRNPGVLTALTRLRGQDNYTYMHSVSVCALMVALGNQLGLDAALIRECGLAGLMHDIGKVRISNDLLNKKGVLKETEFAELRRHARYGHEILTAAGNVTDIVLDACLHHHERIDGSGYPEGLAKGNISLPAQIAAICDVYDATTSDRSYKSAWQPAFALRKMAEWSLGHFDSHIFQAFVKTVGIYPVGTLVRLKSERLGVVVDQNENSLLMPRVKVFFSTRSGFRIAPEILDLSKPGGADEIVSHEKPEAWGIQDLSLLWSGLRRLIA